MSFKVLSRHRSIYVRLGAIAPTDVCVRLSEVFGILIIAPS